MTSRFSILLLDDHIVLEDVDAYFEEVDNFLLLDFERQAADLEALVTISVARVVVNYVLNVEIVARFDSLSEGICRISRSGTSIPFNVQLLLEMHGNLVVSIWICLLAGCSSLSWAATAICLPLTAILASHSSATFTSTTATFTSSTAAFTSSSAIELGVVKISSAPAATTALTWLSSLFTFLLYFFLFLVSAIILTSCLLGLLALVLDDLTVRIALADDVTIGISYANNLPILIALDRLLPFGSLLSCLRLFCLHSCRSSICRSSQLRLVFHLFSHAQNREVLRQLVDAFPCVESVVYSAVRAIDHLGVRLIHCLEAVFAVGVSTR